MYKERGTFETLEMGEVTALSPEEKGYGFIKPLLAPGPDIFFHAADHGIAVPTWGHTEQPYVVTVRNHDQDLPPIGTLVRYLPGVREHDVASAEGNDSKVGAIVWVTVDEHLRAQADSKRYLEALEKKAPR